MSSGPLLTGVDLVDVSRLQAMIEQSGAEFLESAWTPGELDYSGDNPERLAVRWAAKEATMKALGAGIGAISPLHIEVRTSPSAAPYLHLHGSARARERELNICHWSLALSHEGGLAVAFVVALTGGSNV